MSCLSWNVCGLIDLPRKYYVRDARRHLGNLDVLCLQEVVYGFLLNSACHVIWSKGDVFATQHEVGRGGVVTLLSPRLLSSVIFHGTDPMQHVVWIMLSFQNHSFGIVKLYAPNDAVERSHLWHWLADHLLPGTWVFCGDFNMVELAIDKAGLLPFQWKTREREAWFYMRNKLGLFDPNAHHHHSSGVWHTWSNF